MSIAEEEALKEVKATLETEMIYGLIALSCTIIFVFFAASKVAQPIKKTSEEIKNMTEGKSATIAGKVSNDEVGDLINSFNRLVNKIKESESELFQTSKRLQNALLASNDAIFEHDVKNNALFLSDRFYEMLGYSPGEFEATIQNYMSCIVPEDRSKAEKAILNTIRYKSRTDIEIRMAKKDGSVIWVQGKGIVVELDDKDETSSIAGVFSDLTVQKTYEEKILELNQSLEIKVQERTEKLKETLLKLNDLNYKLTSQNEALNTSAVVSTVDLKGNIIEVNDYFCQLTQYSREELIGQNYRILRSGLHSKEFWKEFWTNLLRGKKFRGNICNKSKDGSLFWLDTVIVPVYGQSRKIEYFFTVRFDITERVKTEYALKEAEAMSRNLLESVNDGILGIDTEGRIIFINPSVEKMLGFSLDDLKGKCAHEIFHHHYPDSSEYPSEKCPTRLAFTQGIFTRIDTEVFWRKDGSSFPVNYASTPFYSEGVLAGCVLSFTDITELKKSADDLSRAVKAADTIIDSMPIPTAVTRISDGKIMRLNTAMLEFHGLSLNELREINSTKWYHNPEDRMQLIAKLKRDGSIWNEPVSFIRYKTKEIRYSLVSFIPMKYQDDECLVGAILDITDLKRTEMELSSALESADSMIESIPIPSGVYNYSGKKILRFNRALLGFHNVSEDILYNSDMSDWFVYANEKDFIQEELGKNNTIHNREIYNKVLSSENIRSTLVSFVPIRYMGYDNCFIFTMLDITYLKDIQKELASAKDLAEEATKAKSQFLATMSHEIRTPMNAVIGLTNLVQRTKLDERQMDYLNKIDKSAKSLLGIINDILDFSKIEAGKLSVENTRFNLENVMDTVAQLMAAKVQEKGLEFTIHIGQDVPLNLIGDPLRISQIIVNYCSNAVKFTDEGEIYVDVQVETKFEHNILLKFSVRDTGIGLAEEQKTRMFQKFSQADGSITRKYGGTGLGLAIAKSLAELMGGKVWFESKLGVGSTFYFSALLGVQKENRMIEFTPSIDLRGLNVLVCDDNETAGNFIKEALESFSFRVTLVDSGKKAIEAVENSSENLFGLIIIDWKMPEIDGLEASKIILRKNEIKAPTIIMATAYDKEEIEVKAKEIGIAKLLTKPLSYSILFDSIMEVFGKAISHEKKINDTDPGIAQN